MDQQLIWHYTTGQRLLQIMQDGVLRQSTAYVPDRVRPAVWFTLAPEWEETANKSLTLPNGSVVHLGREETEAFGDGLVRIGVPASDVPLTWADYGRLSGEKVRDLRELRDAAREAGSDVSLWRVSFEPVPDTQWAAIDLWCDGRWEALSALAE